MKLNLEYYPALLAPLCSTEMNREQTTEVRGTGSEGTVDLDLENYETYLSHALEARSYEHLARSGAFGAYSYETVTFCRDAHGNIITQVHPGLVTRRGGSNAVPVEPNDGTIGVGGRTYADILRAIASVRSTMGARGPPIQFIGATLNDAAGGHRAYSDYMRAAAHSSSTFSAGSGYFNETMSAEASPGFAVLGGGGDALGVELNDDMLTALRSTARAMRGHGGSQDLLVDEAGGRFLAIHIHPPQQGDQGLVAAARGTQDGPGDLTQRALQSVIGGLVPLCWNTLDDNILKAGGSPGYIKSSAYAGLALVTGFTFLGLASKKGAKAAARVVASTSMAAVSIALVYNVSENVYIKCVCGILGGVATLATMAIDW